MAFLRAILVALSLAFASVSLWTDDRIEGFQSGDSASEDTARAHELRCTVCQ